MLGSSMPIIKADLQEIGRAVDLLCDPGSVYELRGFGKGTYSGYFSNLESLARAAANLNGQVSAVYFTPNPVLPDLLARAANRVEDWVKSTTTDDQIVKRRWLLIDCDPRRPSGISATNEEHKLAIAKVTELKEQLRQAGWPDPIVADSGNGGHALYAIDLPNSQDSTNLIRDCLNALAFDFEDDMVTVDTSNFNAARIWKAYGTVARKGDSVPERPHRLSRILEVPEHLEVVPVLLLQALAARLPKEPPGRPAQPYNGHGQPFNLDNWLAQYEIPVRYSSPWNSGDQKWVLDHCLWNPEHTDRSAYVVRFASGAIAAGCHHNSCQGKGWPELRAALDPGYRNGQHSRSATSEDGYGLMDEELEPGRPEWEAPQPFDSVAVPDFPVSALPIDVSNYVCQEAEAKQVPVDLPGCLVIGALAAAVGGKGDVYLSPDWQEPVNQYIVSILPSGERKSPIFRSVLRPLEDVERELVEKEAPEILKKKTERDILEKKLQAAKSEAAKLKGDTQTTAEAEARDYAEQLARFVVPEPSRLLADDATPEAVAGLLAEQKGRLAIASTEGGIFDIVGGRYSDNTPNLDMYLKAYSGDTVRVDRRSRSPEFVPNPALTVILTVQPDVVADLASRKAFRGRGFLAR